MLGGTIFAVFMVRLAACCQCASGDIGFSATGQCGFCTLDQLERSDRKVTSRDLIPSWLHVRSREAGLENFSSKRMYKDAWLGASCQAGCVERTR